MYVGTNFLVPLFMLKVLNYITPFIQTIQNPFDFSKIFIFILVLSPNRRPKYETRWSLVRLCHECAQNGYFTSFSFHFWLNSEHVVVVSLIGIPIMHSALKVQKMVQTKKSRNYGSVALLWHNEKVLSLL